MTDYFMLGNVKRIVNQSSLSGKSLDTEFSICVHGL